MNYPNPHGPSCPWYSLAESQGAPNIKWCEETVCAWVSEPANTWSNLSFIIAGLFIVWYSFNKKHHSHLKQFGPIVLIMGALSFFYHQSNFYGSQILDFVGMFLLVGWASGMNLIRAQKLPHKMLLPFYLGYMAINILILHFMYMNNLKFQLLMLVGAIFIVFTEWIASKVSKVQYHWFSISLVLLGIAMSFSMMDHTRYWCDPSGHGLFSQGHALWHWFAGLSMISIYWHFSQMKLEEQKKSSDQ